MEEPHRPTRPPERSGVLQRFRAGRLYEEGRALRRSLRSALRGVRSVDRRRVTLEPEGRPRGRVLVAYLVRGFFEAPGSAVMASHTHYWESMEMARSWRDAGFRVDVIDNYNRDHRPRGRYDVLVATRMILEHLKERVNSDCVSVFHADTAHWLFHACAQYRRLLALQERRGVTLRHRKMVERNRAIEQADRATLLGNDFTEGTYRYAGRPVRRLGISTVHRRPWPQGRDMAAARRRFVWLGSDAMVHKGLDLVLEAFAGLPELELTVCGPVEREADFRDEYRRELYSTPNIRTVGWVDVRGAEFEEVLRRSAALVYPSCSEGQSGGVITCLHGALVPLVSRESGVDVDPAWGRTLDDCSVEGIRRAVRELAETPPDEVEAMARSAWEHAQAHHSRDAFSRAYRAAVTEVLER